MNEYVQSVRAGDVEPLPGARTGRVDLLCLDDVYFLSSTRHAGRTPVHARRDRVAGVACRLRLRRAPRQIKQFSAALVSRFMAGMVALVEVP